LAPPAIQTEERCPQCDYSLAGLPDNHHCPECGFEYESRGFQVFKRPRLYTYVAFACAAAGLIYGMYLLLGGHREVFSLIWTLGMSCWLVGTLAKALRHSRSNRVALWSGGIVIIPSNDAPQWISWDQVGRIGHSVVHGGMVIHSPDSEKIAAFDAEFLASTGRVKRFLSVAKEWLARYRDEHPEQSA